MMEIVKQVKTAVLFLLVMTVLTGILYPALVTLIAQTCFPTAANGSLIKYHDQLIGSRFIGQSFTAPAYFWGRPSETSPFPYNAMASSGSNFSALNQTYLAEVKSRIALLQQSDPKKQSIVPVDLVTASASGLDPEISPFAAIYQVPRIAKARHLSEQVILDLIQKNSEKRSLYVLGEPRVNVLLLNIALDNLNHG